MMYEIRTNSLEAYVALLLFSCLVCFAQNQVLRPQAELRFFAPPPDEPGLEEYEDARRFLLDRSIQTCWRQPDECAAFWISELIDLARAAGCKRIRVDSISGRISCTSHQNAIIMTPRALETSISQNFEPEKRRRDFERVPVRLISIFNGEAETAETDLQRQRPAARYHLVDQQQSSARNRALRSGAWLEQSEKREVERNESKNSTQRGGAGNTIEQAMETDLDGGKMTVKSVGENLVSPKGRIATPEMVPNSAQVATSSGMTQKGIEELASDVPLECEPRFFTYEAHKTDDKGNTCSGLVSASICYGACDTGEIADWLFPHKKSVHKVCTHGSRVRRTAILPDCSEGASYSLREYHYVDAGDCVCQKCHSSDTTCLGSPTQPNLI